MLKITGRRMNAPRLSYAPTFTENLLSVSEIKRGNNCAIVLNVKGGCITSHAYIPPAAIMAPILLHDQRYTVPLATSTPHAAPAHKAQISDFFDERKPRSTQRLHKLPVPRIALAPRVLSPHPAALRPKAQPSSLVYVILHSAETEEDHPVDAVE